MYDAENPDFPAAFRAALLDFLDKKGISQTQMAKRLGISKSRLNTYCRPEKPARPEAEILYLLCVTVGFSFEYRGYKVSAETLTGKPVPQPKDAAKQMMLEFDRQFKLTNEAGAISVTVKRPSGRIELSLSLDAAVS